MVPGWRQQAEKEGSALSAALWFVFHSPILCIWICVV